MKRNSAILLILGIVLVAITAKNALIWFNMQNREYGLVTPKEAQRLIAEKPSLLILDVRGAELFEAGHIVGAINIPLYEREGRLGELDREREMLVYCKTGKCSTAAFILLKDNGYERVYNLKGGITAWISQGYPVTR